MLGFSIPFVLLYTMSHYHSTTAVPKWKRNRLMNKGFVKSSLVPFPHQFSQPQTATCNCSIQETMQQNIILASLHIELLTPKICCHVPSGFPLIIPQATPFLIVAIADSMVNLSAV